MSLISIVYDARMFYEEFMKTNKCCPVCSTFFVLFWVSNPYD